MDSPFWHQIVWLFGAVGVLAILAIIYRLVKRRKGNNNAN